MGRGLELATEPCQRHPGGLRAASPSPIRGHGPSSRSASAWESSVRAHSGARHARTRHLHDLARERITVAAEAPHGAQLVRVDPVLDPQIVAHVHAYNVSDDQIRVLELHDALERAFEADR